MAHHISPPKENSISKSKLKKIVWFGIGRRIFLAFASIMGLYVLTTFFALQNLMRIRNEVTWVHERIEGLQTSLELASAIRDQYAHLAHTIIIGNDTHIKFYEDAKNKSVALAKKARSFATQDEELKWIERIENMLYELDSSYRKQILPGVLKGQQEMVYKEHEQVLSYVAVAQDNATFLAERFSQSISELEVLVTKIQRRTSAWVILFLFAAPVLAATGGLLIVKSVTHPLARLKTGAEQIARGDMDTQIKIQTPDEFGALAHQFNLMAKSIKEHQRQRLLIEKQASIGRLAAGIAHEINNPLAVILGYVRILGKKAHGELSSDLKIIETETLLCKEIVDGLLELSRPLKLKISLLDLREIVDDAVVKLWESNQAKNIKIFVKGNATLQGDGTKLRQIIVNLLKNAIEAVDKDGKIEVEINKTDTHTFLSVNDNGPGFPEELLENLFEPFCTTKQSGTGLGLAVSRAIAQAHKGDLRIDTSEHGASVILNIPNKQKGKA